MHQRDVVIADLHDQRREMCNSTHYHIAQTTQPLLYALQGDAVRQRVAQMLQLLICRRRRHEQAMPVPRRQPPDNPRAGDAALNDGDDVAELGLERREEVGRSDARGRQAVWTDSDAASALERRTGVGQLGEDADIA